MEIKIGEIVKESRTNAFLVNIKLMHGNANHFTQHSIHIPKSEQARLEQLVGLLRDMEAAPWNEARKAYEGMPLFKVWFGNTYLGALDGDKAIDREWPEEISYEEWGKIEDMSFIWEKDVFYSGVIARMDSFELFYYDESGHLRQAEAS